MAGKDARIVSIPRSKIESAGGRAMGGPLYFGDYLDIPPITVRADRVRAELGLALQSLEDGMRSAFEWYAQQKRVPPDFSWEDGLLATVG
jgi:hypothetical protein